ncbi:uncharacterized protein LOC108735867 [Agrilus planipennis]|uniref:Uncharacterized protein LOC108735867 n=1 Tax=Agrilus planipennis TaxID=224129 RepID=A0A1W4WTV4_AGRPL|nr:uncharacterized protein LOC108735867 [Agrilus planipennis]
MLNFREAFRVLGQKLAFLYKTYVLVVVTFTFALGELGHYLIGVTSKDIFSDIHYGDISCQLNNTEYHISELPIPCSAANDSDTCLSYAINGTPYCEWNYNGLGLDYQILAGPSFIAVFTVFGVIFGILADKFHRVYMLSGCAFVFGASVFLCGLIHEFWQFVLLRMVLAAGEAGCNPLSTGILADVYPPEQRGLAMSIFNWGIYVGYGIAFPLGRYLPLRNFFNAGWRVAYCGTGIVTVLQAFVILTLKEPKRQGASPESNAVDTADRDKTILHVIIDPRMIMLVIASSIRHTGGMTLAYNCNLYYATYFPDYDLGWVLFAITLVIGSAGVVVGGVFSDKVVAKLGVRFRVLVLLVSQVIAIPFAFAALYCEPIGAMITLAISFFFAEMWFGIMFAILTEIVPDHLKSTTIGSFLFVIYNIGGNLPIVVDPVSKAIGYREALYVFYVAAYALSSILFFITMFIMKDPKKKKPKDESNVESSRPKIFAMDKLKPLNLHRRKVSDASTVVADTRF